MNKFVSELFNEAGAALLARLEAQCIQARVDLKSGLVSVNSLERLLATANAIQHLVAQLRYEQHSSWVTSLTESPIGAIASYSDKPLSGSEEPNSPDVKGCSPAAPQPVEQTHTHTSQECSSLGATHPTPEITGPLSEAVSLLRQLVELTRKPVRTGGSTP